MSCRRLFPALLLIGACHPAPPARQPIPFVRIDLHVILDQATYAEGDPIYALVELQNTGDDTACVPPTSLDQDWLNLELARDGQRIPGGRMLWIDAIYPPGYRGIPISPGGRAYEPVLLTQRWSDDEPLSPRGLIGQLHPGLYALVARFYPWMEWGPGQEIVSPPVAFTVRSRDSAEDAAFTAWTRIASPLHTGHWPAPQTDSLFDLMSERRGRNPGDPWSLAAAEIVATGEGFGPNGKRHFSRVEDWEAAAARAAPNSALGAWAAYRFATWWPRVGADPAGIRSLIESLTGTLAGAVLEQAARRDITGSSRCTSARRARR